MWFREARDTATSSTPTIGTARNRERLRECGVHLPINEGGSEGKEHNIHSN